jgi:hypothetical protein
VTAPASWRRDARYPGCEVAVIEPAPDPMPLATDEQWNAFLTRPLPPRECTIDRNCTGARDRDVCPVHGRLAATGRPGSR